MECDDRAMMEARLAQNLDLSPLSPRESEVLDVAVQGLSARDIARRLSLTEATVRSHLSAAYSKLGVSGRVELLARMNTTAPRDRTGPTAGGDGRGLQTEGNCLGKPIVAHHTMALWAYSLWFGSAFGEAFYGHTLVIDGRPDTGLIFVWSAMGFVGSILVAIKNQRIGDGRLRARVWVGDLAVMAAAMILIAVLPVFVGMLKGIVLLALFCPYLYWYIRTLRAAGLWQPPARAK
jgi:DNA-binding CsgD family transcriptional regulator